MIKSMLHLEVVNERIGTHSIHHVLFSTHNCSDAQLHQLDYRLHALQAAEGGPAAEGGAEAAALQAHLDSAMQAGLIQMSGLGPSGSGSGGPGDPARDGSQSAGTC